MIKEGQESGMTHLSATQSELVARIVDLLLEQELEPGRRVTEEMLTAAFQVSRSPVRAALRFLGENGLLTRGERGYFIPPNFKELSRQPALIPRSADQTLYDKIARDRMRGDLPETASENEMMRRYKVPRSQLVRVLNRFAQERLVERSTGHGWRFLPTLDTQEAYLASYRFRMIIEPAGILEPTFAVDEKRLTHLLELHLSFKRLKDSELKHSTQRMFALNSQFHETVASFSNNRFIIQATQQQSRLRQLSETYTMDLERTRVRLNEHISIMEALREGEREWAAHLLRRHLEVASRLRPPFADAHQSH